MARTTLVLSDDRLAQLKSLARLRRQSLSSLVEQLLGESLSPAHRPARRGRPVSLPSFDLGAASVDINDRQALYERMGGR